MTGPARFGEQAGETVVAAQFLEMPVSTSALKNPYAWLAEFGFEAPSVSAK